MKSPAFSEFRSLMDLWDEATVSKKKKEKLQDLIQGNGLILFFKKEGTVYGAPEESRLAFARLKEDEFDGSFIAFKLADALKGKSVKAEFGKDQLDEIKVIDREEAEKSLLNL